jgi:AraC family transcriptional regulator
MRDGELVLRPDTTGPYEVSWRALSSEPTRALYLHLSRDLVARTAEELADHDAARLSVVKLESFEDPLLRQIGLTLWQELAQPAPTGKLYAQAAAQLLAVHLLRHYTSAQLQIKEISQNLNQRQVKQVSDFVAANLGQDLSLEDLARQVGFSPYHFARLFRTTTGESPHQFVVRQRVEKAKYLLKATNAPLVHIAHESGFANQSHLTRHFKRYMGLTPKAFRQQQ